MKIKKLLWVAVFAFLCAGCSEEVVTPTDGHDNDPPPAEYDPD